MRKHFLILILMALLPLVGWAEPAPAGTVTITPHVINVYYPATAVPLVALDNFDISGDIPAGFAGETDAERKAAAKASLLPNLQITIVGNADMPAVTGSVKYYFSVVGDNLDEKWDGTTFTMAYNGDLNVLPRDLATATFYVPTTDANYDELSESYAYTYDGTEKSPKPIVCIGAYDPDDDSNQLIEGTDFNFAYIHNIDANGVDVVVGDEHYVKPQVKIVAATNEGYAGFKTLDFAINPKAFGTDVTIADITGATYNGGADVIPTLNVTDAAIPNKVLAYDIDYVFDTDYDTDGWKNNVNATPADPTEEQLASVKIKGKGNYQGTSTLLKTFSIAKKNIAADDIEWNGVIEQLNYPVAADAQGTANIRWTGAESAIEGIDYELSNTGSIGLGTITASVNATGAAAANYTGTKTTNFEIIPGYINGVTIQFKKLNPDFNPEQEESELNQRYLAGAPTFVYKGEAIKPGMNVDGVDLLVTKGDYVLEKGVDYVIVENGYKNNINATAPGAEDADKPTVTIKGIGNWKL